jgi:hypothetical protein
MSIFRVVAQISQRAIFLAARHTTQHLKTKMLCCCRGHKFYFQALRTHTFCLEFRANCERLASNPQLASSLIKQQPPYTTEKGDRQMSSHVEDKQAAYRKCVRSHTSNATDALAVNISSTRAPSAIQVFCLCGTYLMRWVGSKYL